MTNKTQALVKCSEVSKQSQNAVVATASSLAIMILEENREKGHIIRIPSLNIIINGKNSTANSKETKPSQVVS